MSTPRVSLIIATHNRATLLPGAIESALTAGEDVEVIVVDDASRDATLEVCSKFPQIKVVRLKRNLGLAAARNAGLSVARGAYLSFLDDDDRRLPNSLAGQLAALEKDQEAALCYGRVLIADCRTGEPNGEVFPQEIFNGDLFWKLARGNFVPGLSVVARREPFLAAGLFRGVLRQVEDWDLWLRLSESWPFTAVPEPVAIYRMFDRGSGQLSSNRARMAIAAAAVQRHALASVRAQGDPIRARESRRYFLQVTRYTLLLETTEALLAGERHLARQNLAAVLRLLPKTFARAEFRQLAKCSIALRRDDQKQLKIIRKKILADGIT